MLSDLVGKSHVFEDGITLTILEVKHRDENVFWVVYQTNDGIHIPKKLMMPELEFVNSYGHLFGLKDAPKNL